MNAWERHQRLLSVPGVILPMYTIYEKPRDFPAHYVVRPCLVNRDGVVTMVSVACLYEYLSDAMGECAELGLVFLQANEQDDPCIVGTFV